MSALPVEGVNTVESPSGQITNVLLRKGSGRQISAAMLMGGQKSSVILSSCFFSDLGESDPMMSFILAIYCCAALHHFIRNRALRKGQASGLLFHPPVSAAAFACVSFCVPACTTQQSVFYYYTIILLLSILIVTNMHTLYYTLPRFT